MEPLFSLHIIRVQWDSAKSQIVVFEESEALPFVNEADQKFYVETVTYPSLGDGDRERFGQLAVYFPRDVPPRIKRENVPAGRPMVSVDSTSHPGWWIESGEWEKIPPKGTADFFYKKSDLCSTAGESELFIAEQQCRIRVFPSGFRPDEFDGLTQAFHDNLFALIHNAKSPGFISHHSDEALVSDEALDAFETFLQACGSILKAPCQTLQERFEVVPLSRAKPTAKTVAAVAARGLQRTIVGRSHAESGDTPENNYIAGIIKKVRDLSCLYDAQLSHTQASIASRQLDISKSQARLTWRKEGAACGAEDPDAEKSDRSKKDFDEAIAALLSKESGGDKGIFIADFLKSDGDFYRVRGSWSWEDRKFTLTMSLPASRAINRIFRKGKPLTIQFVAATHFEPEGNESLKVSQPRFSLIEMTPLSRPSAVEQYYIEKNLNSLIVQRDSWCEMKAKLERRQDRLSVLLTQANLLIKSFDGFCSRPITSTPRSLILLQEPNYRAAQSAYRWYVEKTGIREELLEFMPIPAYRGIIDLPRLYERWCLLEVISVLILTFGFSPKNSNWQADLVKAVREKGQSHFSMTLENSQYARSIELEYEPPRSPKASNTKNKPDMVLRFRSISCQPAREVTLVMDAKCKDYSDVRWRNGLVSDVTEIDRKYRQKDFAEDYPDYIFVLHPCLSAVAGQDTTQTWGDSSYYGGGRLIGDDVSLPDHTRGGILLRPQSHQKHSRDDLQRLIAMIMEMGMEQKAASRSERGTDARSKLPLFCVVCGEGVLPENELNEVGQIGRSTTGGNVKHWYVCPSESCQHLAIHSFCHKCKRRLYKHGDYWTYHDMTNSSGYTIRCPHCEEEPQVL